MVWGCIAASGVGKLVIIEGIMNKYMYLHILKKNRTFKSTETGMKKQLSLVTISLLIFHLKSSRLHKKTTFILHS